MRAESALFLLIGAAVWLPHVLITHAVILNESPTNIVGTVSFTVSQQSDRGKNARLSEFTKIEILLFLL